MTIGAVGSNTSCPHLVKKMRRVILTGCLWEASEDGHLFGLVLLGLRVR